jgi:ABC-2 type transport system permease protein
MSDRPDWVPVARWEFLRILKRADFIIAVLLTPAMIFAVSFMVGRLGGKTRSVAVVRVDASGAIQATGEAALPHLAGFRWTDPGPAAADTTALRAALARKAFDAAYVLPADFGRQPPEIVELTRRAPPRWAPRIHTVIRDEMRRQRLAAMGLSSEQLASLQDSLVIHRHRAVGRQSGSGRAEFLVTFAILLLMVTMIMSGVSYLMIGISGEKSARVTEVVISAIPAQAWMDGKLLAFTGIGLVTGFIWAASLLMISGSFGMILPGSVNAGNLAVSAIFAVLGLYLYNALLAALMASAQSLQSASKWQSNFLMLPFIPVFFLSALMENPDSIGMTVLSHVPFFAPVMFPARLVLGGVRWWEILLALALLTAACWYLRRVAGRVFRLGMLMYGKDMTLPELIRWARVK